MTEQAADAKRVCELLGLDATAIETDAAHAIPTPKSWESLTQNGEDSKEPPPFDTEPTSDAAAHTEKPKATKARKHSTKARQRKR